MCGEIYASGETINTCYYELHNKARYELEPCIADFARFEEGYNKDALEIGAGMGADHLEWAKSYPKHLVGIAISSRAIEHTKDGGYFYGLDSDVKVADVENVPFGDNTFDI